MKMLCGPLWARLSLLVLLFWSAMAPVHLTDEVHALLPASATHHAEIHCEEQKQCEAPNDDLTTPLSGEQHERHHEAQCSNDGTFSYTQFDETVHVAPTHWVVTFLECPPVPQPVSLTVPDGDLRGRAPPERECFHHQPSYPFQSGRAPPDRA